MRNLFSRPHYSRMNTFLTHLLCFFLCSLLMITSFGLKSVFAEGQSNMRAIVQRVTQASVTVGDELVSSIGKGICVLLGISREDDAKDTEFMVKKLLNLRVFDDGEGKRWSKSVSDLKLEILCVSQFTLQAVLKGNKPDFHCAMMAEESEKFYNEFLEKLMSSYDADKVKDGRFGAYMQVHIQNDGPVTIELNSPPPKQGKKQNPTTQGQDQPTET